MVEVEVQEPPSTFSRLGQESDYAFFQLFCYSYFVSKLYNANPTKKGLALAGDFVRETTKQAADELSEFKVSFRQNFNLVKIGKKKLILKTTRIRLHMKNL